MSSDLQSALNRLGSRCQLFQSAKQLERCRPRLTDTLSCPVEAFILRDQGMFVSRRKYDNFYDDAVN